MGSDFSVREQEIRAAIERGQSQDASLWELKRAGATIIEAIRLMRSSYKIGLGEAKVVVSKHPAWKAVADANQPLHDALVTALDDQASSSSGK
ncbi:MAG: hypothetical protein JJ884_13535 [Maricaulis sp.]|uniref:hypothetical protein n=1 Tax=Maricaulis sp. TaxID=1486257 RepID=UPI001B2EF4A9|nr:hypothetical protein [Maricaulis sp.]MBO6730316.1 hypothetical protein [Maricaulis sp.]MBO6848533.1 hypothetical protein [Maricaulis sp.]MBO6878458.1 hypothetical protein [Maricaulis sp.]